ncbi:hypothetical protein ACKWMY_27455 [Serratia sp. J2]|uniref:hypothetical protein n=1 Tax=Serratia sp. J2 TaxID=3386551 RepID=UPI0039174FAA
MIDLGESIKDVAKKMIAMNIWPQHVIETINLSLFNLINTLAHPSLSMLMLGHFFARDVIIVVPCILLLNWFFAKKDIKKTVLAAAFSGVLVIGLNLCISLFWRYPRPFMVPVGHTFITHVADVSFPYHISLISAVVISLLLQVGVRFQGSL